MELLDRFIEAAGTYRGAGVDHDDEEVVGTLTIEPAVSEAGVSLHFEAESQTDGELVHEEQMLVGFTRSGELYLWGLDSSTERIRKHELRDVEYDDHSAMFKFGVGRPDNKSAYREEVAFELADDRISLNYAWGMPGEPLEPRSSVDLVPEPQYQISQRAEAGDVEYRQFTSRPDDKVLEAVGGIRRRVFGDVDTPLGDESFWDAERHPHLLVAELDGQIVGFKAGYERRPGRFYSWLGAVLPEFRRHGIATELLKRQHVWADEAGFDTVRTKTTNEWREMLILNLEEGFDLVGTELDGEGDVKIVLEKPL